MQISIVASTPAILLHKLLPQRSVREVGQHVFYTFCIEHISWFAFNELRYRVHNAIVIDDEFVMALPDLTDTDPMLVDYARDHVDDCAFLLDVGIPAKLVEYLRPNASGVDAVLTVSLSQMADLCNELLCIHAPSELRDLIYEMALAVNDINTLAEAMLVPECVAQGYCTKRDCCGSAVHITTLKQQLEEVLKLDSNPQQLE